MAEPTTGSGSAGTVQYAPTQSQLSAVFNYQPLGIAWSTPQLNWLRVKFIPDSPSDQQLDNSTIRLNKNIDENLNFCLRASWTFIASCSDGTLQRQFETLRLLAQHVALDSSMRSQSPMLPLDFHPPGWRQTVTLERRVDSTDDKDPLYSRTAAFRFANGVVQAALRTSEQRLKFHFDPAPQFQFITDRMNMWTNIDEKSQDMALWVRYEAAFMILFIKCRRKVHRLSKDNMLGEEVANLLGQISYVRNLAKISPHYHAYMLTWNHLSAYVTSISMSFEDYNNMTLGGDEWKSKLTVRRSPIMDMKDSDERIRLAQLLIKIILLQLTRSPYYDKCDELGEPLCSWHEPSQALAGQNEREEDDGYVEP